MSKKWKQYDDISTDKQMALADELWKLQVSQQKKKMGDIRDISDIKKKDKKQHITEHGLPTDLEKKIVGKKSKKGKVNTNRSLEVFDEAEPVVEEEPVVVSEMDNLLKNELEARLARDTSDIPTTPIPLSKESAEAISAQLPKEQIIERPAFSARAMRAMEEAKANEPKARHISFRIIPELERGVIDDEVIPTSFSTNGSSYEDDLIAQWTEDEFVDAAFNCLRLIVAVKCPAAIFARDEFREYMHNVTDYNDAKYFFVLDDFYVYAYIIDTESFNRLVDVLWNKEESAEYFALNTIAILQAVDNYQSSFQHKDTDMVRAFKTAYSTPELFAKEFFADEDTVVSETDIPEIECGISTIGLDGLINVVYAFINVSTGGSLDNDDESDEMYGAFVDDEGEEPIEEEVTEEASTPAASDNHVISVDFSQTSDQTAEVPVPVAADIPDEDLLSEGVEMVDADSENESMILDVNHKKGIRA